MVWKVKVIKIEEKRLSVGIDYEIYNEDLLMSSESIIIQGDVVDIPSLKLDAENKVRKLKGIVDSIASVKSLEGKELFYDEVTKELKQ